MSQEYAGYGFKASDISNEGFLRFMKKHDPDTYRDMVVEKFGYDKCLGILTEDEHEILAGEAEDWLVFNTHYGFKANYVANVMCKKTCEGLFYGVDGKYIVYPPIRFPDDVTEEKRLYIENRGDLQRIVNNFFPGEEISFGNIWLATPCWANPNYYMD